MKVFYVNFKKIHSLALRAVLHYRNNKARSIPHDSPKWCIFERIYMTIRMFIYFIVSNDYVMSHIRATMAISEPVKHNDVIIVPLCANR